MEKKLIQRMPVVLSLSLLSLIATASAKPLSVTEFGGKKDKDLGWRVVDDGVMGGLSKGKITVGRSGTLTFNGDLSLENNGGFSSIRTGSIELDLSKYSGLVARVKGDGRTYQMRLGTEARYRGMEVSFMAEFPTTEGQWTEVSIPFSDFTGSFRGMKLKDQVLDPAKVRRVGLLLADKKAGSFELKVDWIRAYSSESPSETIVGKALADGRFGTLAAALKAAGLVDVLNGEGPLTVFAPTDEAFAKLPKGTVEDLLKPENQEKLKSVLTYHVSPGKTLLGTALESGNADTIQGEALAISFADGRVLVNESPVLNADIECSNGVIHVVESVLLPPSPEVSNDLLGVATKAGVFKTLLAAVKAADLEEALTGEGPLTILAPTDDAFAALPKGTVESLLEPKNRDRLISILSYHAIVGGVSAGDALNASTAKTLNGKTVKFSVQNGTLKVNGATIRKTDIKCDNGVVHVIDKVLLPAASNSEDCEKSVKKDPTTMIEEAISRGVPVFNRGDHAQCATIYRDCLLAVTGTNQLDCSTREALETLLIKAKKEKDATSRAWMLRRGLDLVGQTLNAPRG